MRKTLLSIAIFLFSLTSVMGQLIPITLPADGNWPTIVGDSIMIIGPRQNELTEEQRYFNPIYLMVYPGKEHLKAQMIRAGACDCDLTKPNRRIGVFSVAPDKKVSFSQGNLQYLPAINLWKFANTQYEYLGNANKYLKPTFRNWVDLFGWSANNTTAPFGVSTSTNVADYAGDFVDWGTNTICGDAPGTWRTLSADEWEYLFEKRKNALQLRSKGSIDGHRGHILLPDDWVLPEGVQFVAEPDNLTMELDINTYTPAEWSIMEEAGAVFLPAAGRRDGTTVGYLVEYSGVWSSTSTTNTNAFHTYYNYDSQIIEPHWTSATSRINGRSVRLVHDTIVQRPEPGRRIGVFSVAADKQVSFSQGNLQYIQSRDEWRFAENQWDYIGEDNIKDGQLANRIDLFGWSANNTTAPFGISTSTNDADYKGAFVDWGTNIIQSDASGTWRTLSSEEWEYLRNGRLNAQQLLGIACVNGINGLILLPDNCVLPDDFHFKCGTHTLYGEEYFKEVNDYTLDEWLVLQQLEAVFLPASGTCIGINYQNSRIGGSYYSSSPSSEYYACIFNLRSNITRTMSGQSRHIARAVRLVHDTIVPETISEPCLVVKVNDTLSINMMCVEGGTFMMGQGEDAHPVSLSSYSIGQTEVTQALWEAVMGTNPSANTANKQLPVIKISWYDCQEFIKKLNQQTGMRFRLPTEAEWEYAARGGQRSKGYTYAGSNDIDQVGWYNGNSSNKTHAVGQKQPNELGIYDMTGNAWEWCEDYYDADKTMHVVKSGSFYDAESMCRIDSRTGRAADYKSYIGLRLVLDERSTPPEPEYVDLGLSVKWATFNIGATSPEDYGDYFAWGETEPKETYSWATYKWCDGTDANITKYNTADGKTILEPADDAAQVHWGGKWRMPTKEECQELLDKCTWKEETRNGINGHIVTGPNGNSIFIPTTGYHNDDNGTGVQGLGTITYLWTSSTPGNANAYDLLLSHPTLADGIGSNTRRVGMPIRPVYDDRPPKRIGVFSVAADKQVSFSQGNLQYIQSTDTWQFAANQLEYMGHKHYRNGQLADTIEYFGWSGKNSKTPWGISLSTESSDYEGEFLDWGINTIAGSAPNTWRTLSNDEWLYICQGRKNADQLLGLGKISSIFGLIILPDDWVAPEGITFTPNDNNPDANVYSLQQWTAMEEAGAIFIPPTGYFNHDIDNMRYVGNYGYARNNTLTANGLQIYTLFKPSEIQYSRSAEGNNGNLYYAFPQRLVHDTIVPKPEPEYVDLGLSVKWATFNVGATSPNEIGNFYAWGEIEPKDTYTVNNYKWWNKTSKETTKYCTIDSLAYGGIADGLTELQPQDDIAHTLKGEHWRMPDLDECKELGNGCTWTVSTRQGQIGFEGTSKINGNTIFLPVVGFRAGVNLVHETLGGYWSSTLNIEKQSCAMGLYLNRETPSVGIYYNSSRQNGFLIRPVYDDRVE